jgi:uncharacterized damage-inducible protein DinB
MTPFFKELMTYNRWSNQQLIGLFLAHPEHYSDRLATLMSHTINAHLIWNSRLNPTLKHLGVWTVHSLEDLKSLDEQNYAQSIAIIENVPLEQSISYKNTSGQVFESTAKDMLYHIVNHSTYHRGQLMTGLKTQGVTPIGTDYIFYKRD